MTSIVDLYLNAWKCYMTQKVNLRTPVIMKCHCGGNFWSTWFLRESKVKFANFILFLWKILNLEYIYMWSLDTVQLLLHIISQR